MAPAASQPELPDEVTEDILLRLDGAADVARAATACRSHLRVVRDRRFLLRFRSLRPPPLIGLLSSGGKLHPAEPPHSSAPAARGVASDWAGGDFPFSSFLPSRGIAAFTDWSVCDTRGGRVLLYRSRRGESAAAFLDLAVGDPLHRQFVLIPPIPDEIVLKRYSAEMRSEPFLAAALDEEEGQCQFQVIYNWMSNYKIDTFVFSSGTGKWRAATSFSFLPDRLILSPKVLVRHYAGGGCFCWVHFGCKHMLVLDQREMNFSIVGLPDFNDRWNIEGLAVFGTRMTNSRLGFAVLRVHPDTLELYCRNENDNGGGGAEEWYDRSFVPLPEPGRCSYKIVGAAEGYLVLEGRMQLERTRYFTLDLKTFQAERLCMPDSAIYPAYLYASYPSLLSPPTI
ncbi:unnamed protein product [Urochloa decumbens]|uniref:F-box domain-containing protein n=1 Tax=Urochloa decumbens TaxID=240449 RepID=A0ABC9H4B6_9POAL